MRRAIVAVAALMLALAMVAVAGLAVSQPPPQQGPQTASEVELRLEMQHLWETHMHDLHNLITAELNDLPETPVVLQKSLEHIDMTTAALEPFYGQEAANTMNQLLKAHEAAAYAYVLAAEVGDEAGKQAAIANSTQVVDQIAQCLSSLNPNWPYETARALFLTHVNDIVNITDLKVAQNFQASEEAVETAVQNARIIADVMSDGIVAQFPERFTA